MSRTRISVEVFKQFFFGKSLFPLKSNSWHQFNWIKCFWLYKMFRHYSNLIVWSKMCKASAIKSISSFQVLFLAIFLHKQTIFLFSLVTCMVRWLSFSFSLYLFDSLSIDRGRHGSYAVNTFSSFICLSSKITQEEQNLHYNTKTQHLYCLVYIL